MSDISYNVVVDDETWESTLSDLKNKDTTIKEMLSEFLSIMESISENELMDTTTASNINSFCTTLKMIQTEFDGIYETVSNAVNTLKNNVSEKDSWK